MVAIGSDEKREQGKVIKEGQMKEREGVFAEYCKFRENTYNSTPLQLHYSIIQRLCHEDEEHSRAAWEGGYLRKFKYVRRLRSICCICG